MPKKTKRRIYLTLNEWLYLIELHDKDIQKFRIEFSTIKEKPYNSDMVKWFRKKKKQFEESNYDINILKNKTGKLNRSKLAGAKKKVKIDSSHLDKEDIDKLLEHYYEILKKEKNNSDLNKLKKIIKDSKSSSRSWEKSGFVSKSTVCRWRSEKKEIKKININNIAWTNDEIDEYIFEIFNKYKQRLGRKPISVILKNEYNINISDRQVGRRMNRMRLCCHVRRKKFYYSDKNKPKTNNTKINNLVNRDYNNLFHNENIIATDVTYMNSTNDLKQNHIYLSAAISHKTKKIIGFSISKNNDINLIIDTFKKVDFKKEKTIIHSDGAMLYKSHEFIDFCKKNSIIQSMSRPGNALDNRVVEYWFSIFKNEFLKHINTKKYSFNEFKLEVEKYIDYYNNQRIQEKLFWLTPNQYENILKNNI